MMQSRNNRITVFVMKAGICLLAGGVAMMIFTPASLFGKIIFAAAVTVLAIIINRPIVWLVNKYQPELEEVKECFNCANRVWYEEENHYECIVYGYGAECSGNPSKPLHRRIVKE